MGNVNDRRPCIECGRNQANHDNDECFGYSPRADAAAGAASIAQVPEPFDVSDEANLSRFFDGLPSDGLPRWTRGESN